MKNRIARMIAIAMASVGLTAAADAPAVKQDANPVVEAMASIGALIAGADKTVDAAAATATPEPASTAAAAKETSGEPAAAQNRRSVKNSVILVTAGAAAGAALGQTLGKDSKAAMIGAALGGAAGLIYDRMTYKNPGKI